MPAKGYNINLGGLGGKYNEAMLSAKKANAAYHLVTTVPQHGINGAGEIQEVTRWRDELAPANLIWRTYSNLEGDWIKQLGYDKTRQMLNDSIARYTARCQNWANKLAKRWHDEGLPDVIRDDPSNEPGLDANNVVLNTRYVIRCVALQNACNFFDVKVAVGAFSVGTPHEDMIDSGVFDPLLRIVKYISLHEYPAGLPGAGDLFEYEQLLEPETYWQKLPDAVWETDSRYWLERRCDRMYLRAKSLGNEIEICITETNTSEDIPDAVHVNNALKARGLALPECGGDLRGHQAWRNYYEKVFNDTDFQRNVAQILEYQVLNVNNMPYIIADCTFTLDELWGTGAKGRNRCHNYLGDDCYQIRHEYLPAINAKFANQTSPTPQPEPIQEPEQGVDYEMIPAVLTTLKSTNIRKERNTTFEPDIILYKGDELPVLRSDKPLWAGSGFMWYRLLLNDEIFYVAKDNNLLIDETDIPDTTPEPTPDEPIIDNEVVKGMIARLDAQDRLIDALTSQIAELLAEFEPVQIDFVHTTLEAPRILQKPIGLAFVDIAKELQAWGYRYAGIVTASQIADEIYSTTTPDMSLGGMLDEIMNGGDEDDLPRAGKKFGISEFT